MSATANAVPSNLAEIRAKHPMPWKSRMAADGTNLIFVLDAQGSVVELFTILHFTELVTAQLAQQRKPA